MRIQERQKTGVRGWIMRYIFVLKEETEQALSWKQDYILGRTVDWAICPISMETTYQQENQSPRKEEPQGLYLDSPLPKRIP